MTGLLRRARPHVGRLPVVTVLLVLLCRCGGEQQSRPPASVAPGPPHGGAHEETVSPTAAPAGGATFAPPPAQPPPPPPSPEDQRDLRKAERITAAVELDRALRELDAASSDCESACRALASMERATTHLCSLAEDPGDQRLCDDAKARLTTAKSRVRAACGACR